MVKLDRESHLDPDGDTDFRSSRPLIVVLVLKVKSYPSLRYTVMNGAPILISGQWNKSISIPVRDTAVSNPNVSRT